MAKILIIDKSDTAREALAEELTADGHEVIAASEYFEAVDALEKSIRIDNPKRKAFDLICLDHPAGRSGTYTLFRIRDQRMLTHVPVIGAIREENVWWEVDERNTHKNFKTLDKQPREGSSEYFWDSKQVQKLFLLPA